MYIMANEGLQRALIGDGFVAGLVALTLSPLAIPIALGAVGFGIAGAYNLSKQPQRPSSEYCAAMKNSYSLLKNDVKSAYGGIKSGCGKIKSLYDKFLKWYNTRYGSDGVNPENPTPGPTNTPDEVAARINTDNENRNTENGLEDVVNDSKNVSDSDSNNQENVVPGYSSAHEYVKGYLDRRYDRKNFRHINYNISEDGRKFDITRKTLSDINKNSIEMPNNGWVYDYVGVEEVVGGGFKTFYEYTGDVEDKVA